MSVSIVKPSSVTPSEGPVVEIANRVKVPKPEDAKKAMAGGLVVATGNFADIKVGWSGNTIDKPLNNVNEIEKWLNTNNAVHDVEIGNKRFITVDLPKNVMEGFYENFANEGGWTLLHRGYKRMPSNKETDWEQSYKDYLLANEIFAFVANKYTSTNSTLLTQDYHLMAFADAIEKYGNRRPNSLFIHIPGADSNILKAAPSDFAKCFEDLSKKLFKFGLVGVQSPRDLIGWAGFFGERDCRPPALHEELMIMKCQGHKMAWTVMPVGINVDEVQSIAQQNEDTPRVRSIIKEAGGNIAGIGWGRLDPAKNLVRKLQAHTLLATQGFISPTATFLQVASEASRMGIRSYQDEALRLATVIDTANLLHGGQHIIRPINPEEGHALHRDICLGLARHASICVEVSEWDGHLLIANEFLAAQDPKDPGVLVLSGDKEGKGGVGAGHILHRLFNCAVMVNPLSVHDIARGMGAAYDMPLRERIARHEQGMEAIRKFDDKNFRTSLINMTLAAHQLN